MQEIDYFDAVAGRIVGGAIRYTVLFAVGVVSTLSFVALSAAIIMSIRSDMPAQLTLMQFMPYMIFALLLLAIVALLRMFRIDLLALSGRALQAIRADVALSTILLVSIYVLVFV